MLSLRITFITAFICLSCSILLSQKNLELTGRLAYSPRSQNAVSGFLLSDVWGYVAPDGHEYALVGVFSGLSIVDLEDPANPVEIHFIEGAESFWRDIKTYGSFAYVSNETGGGITIVDLSNLPETIESKNINPQGATTAHNLYQDQGTLFITGSNRQNGGLIMMDLTVDPWNPQFVGAYNQAYVHDVYVRDNIAYAAEINDLRLRILDINDVSASQVLGERTYAGAFTHNTWLNSSSEVCFTTDETGAAYIIAWDVSDPTNIEELDRIRSSLSDGQAIPHNVHVLNDFIVASYYGDGILLVDAARPHNLIEVGYFDSFPEGVLGFVGCWGAYPFLPSGLVLASDMSNGLFVLQPSYTRASYFEGSVVDAVSGEPIREVSLFFEGVEGSEFSTDNEGAFASGLAEEGERKVIISHPDYVTDTVLLTLVSGEVDSQVIELQPLMAVSNRSTLNSHSISALPIPVSDRLSVKIPQRNATSWELLSIQGQRVAYGQIPYRSNSIAIQFPFPPGIYLLRVNTQEGESAILKIQK